MPARSEFAGPRHFGIRHGATEADQHALALKHGLALLGPDFVCSICWKCHGRGVPDREYERGALSCDWCCGTGLVQGHIGAYPAFDSQRHQVLVAASQSLLLNFEVCVC